MTVSSTVARIAYTGTGTVGPFPYPFRIFAADDLEVTTVDLSGVATVLAYPAAYSVAGVLLGAGGSITLTTALTSGWTLIIRRVPDLTQLTGIRNQGPFFAGTHEDVFDRLVMIDQAQQDDIDRAVRAPSGNPIDGTIANFTPTYYLRVKADGSGIEGVTAVVAAQNFIQSGSGAVTRSANSKMADIVSVTDFGAKGDGVTDDSTAFSLAFQSGAKRVLIPAPGSFYKLAHPVNCTGLAAMIVDCHGSLAQTVEPIRFAHTGIGFDCVGSRIVWNDLNVINAAGFTPSCYWFLARDATDGSFEGARFNNCHASGDTLHGLAYNYGCEGCTFNDCYFYATSGEQVVTVTGSNISAITSTFRAIPSTPQSTSVIKFIGGEYYHAGSSATRCVFLLDQASDVTFRDQFWFCRGGLAYVHAVHSSGGETVFVTIDAIRCEPGTPPSYVVFFDSSVAAVAGWVLWALTNMQATANLNIVFASDLANVQRLTYSGISDGTGVGMSAKTVVGVRYDGTTFVGRAGGSVSTSTFVGPASTWTFNGADTGNIKIDTTNGGYDFSASASGTQAMPSRALTDYNAKLFTPAMTIGAGAPTSYSTQEGSATKTGNRVYFTMRVVLNVLGASTGTIALTGLPWPAVNTNEVNPCECVLSGINLAAGWVSGIVVGGTSTVQFQIRTFGTPIAVANMTHAALANGADFFISGSYRV